MQNNYIAIKNFIVHNTFETVTKILNEQGQVTDKIIDDLQDKLYEQISQVPDIKMGKTGVRSVIVDYITSEFGSQVMGVDPMYKTKVMEDDAWKKYRRQIREARGVKRVKVYCAQKEE